VAVLDRIRNSSNGNAGQDIEGSMVDVGPKIVKPSFNFEKVFYH
jgi:hypothetical protein